MPNVTRIVDPIQQMTVAINDARITSEDGDSGVLPYSALHILREMSSTIPPSIDVRLTRLVYESKGIRAIGITDSFNSVNTIQKKFRALPSVLNCHYQLHETNT